MADSTTNLDLLSSGQAQKEITQNALSDAMSKASLFGRRASTTTALTWGFYGGKLGGVATKITNGTVALTASANNYVEADKTTGVVSVNQTAFTSGKIQLYKVVTGSSTVTSYEDWRDEIMVGSATPIATTSTVGAVKPDGTTITIDANGVISSAGGGASITVKDEGVTLTTTATSIAFIGAGVTTTNTAGEVTVNIPGGGGGSTDYRNFPDRLLFGITAAYENSNTFFPYTNGGWTSGTQINITSTDLNYGNWGSLPRYQLQTGATVGAIINNYPTYLIFKRDIKSKFAVHCIFGVSTSASYLFNTDNTCFAFSIFGGSNDIIGSGYDFTVNTNLQPTVGWRVADTNIQIIYRNDSNILTFIDLGTNFPIPRNNTQKLAYEAIIKKIDNTANYTIIVNRLDAGDEVTATSTNIITGRAISTTVGNLFKPTVQLKTTVASAKQIYINRVHVYSWIE